MHSASLVTEANEAEDVGRLIHGNTQPLCDAIDKSPKSRHVEASIGQNKLHHEMFAIGAPVRVMPATLLLRRHRYSRVGAVGIKGDKPIEASSLVCLLVFPS